MNANLTSVRRFFLVAFAILSVLSAQAVKNKDWYVSDDMQYGRGIVPDANCTNDLQYAILNCTGGYTVWVDDGFIWDKGHSYANYATNRITMGGVTVRSKSGCVDESDPKHIKGAVIRGSYDPVSGSTGSAAIRGVNMSSASGKLIGFIVENSADAANASRGGGGIYGPGIVSNCVIRNCKAGRGGGVSGARVYHCVITNCSAGIGAGIYNSAMVSRTDVAYCRGTAFGIGWYDKTGYLCITNCFVHSNAGGGIGATGTTADGNVYHTVISNNSSVAVRGVNDSRQARPRFFNCTIISNVAASGWTDGAGAYHCELHDCDVIGNRIGAVAGCGAGCNDCWIYGGTVSGNVLEGSSKSSGSGAGVYGCKVWDCEITGNEMGYGTGGGCYSSKLIGCQIRDNVIANGGFDGGGCRFCTLTNCIVSGNICRASTTSSSGAGAGINGGTAVSCRIFNNVGGFRGGGAYAAILENCIVSNNVTRSTNGGAGGGGAFNCEAYNSIFADNHVANGIGGVDAYENTVNDSCLVNCTIVNNSDSGFAGLKSVINCIAWGNGTKASSCTACTNSCVEKLSCSAQDGCFSSDPRLDARYAPKSAKCHNKALPFDWMADPNDVRSKDVYGAARVQGKGPDIGAVEQPDFGLMMLVR